MANSILGSGNFNSSPVASNPVQLRQQFQQFAQQLHGQNPQMLVQQLVQSGQMSQQQLNQLMQQAQGFVSMFRR